MEAAVVRSLRPIELFAIGAVAVVVPLLIWSLILCLEMQ